MSVRQILASKRVVAAAAVPVAVLASGGMVWASSYSAFSDKVENPASNWATGTVKLTGDGSTAMFSASNLKPGASGSKCLVVTSTGSLASNVKVYGTSFSTTNGLASHLNIKVESGTGGSFNNCSGFITSGAAAFDGTAASFGADKTDFASGVGTWAAPAGNQNRTYKITYTLSDNTPNTAQSGTVNLGFTWEAQNS